MKRFLNYLLIAATVCGISFAAASCSKDDGDNVEALTAEQQTLIEQLYGEWQKANSGDDDDKNNNLNDVNGNVDVNNGGGGVNVVR